MDPSILSFKEAEPEQVQVPGLAASVVESDRQDDQSPVAEVLLDQPETRHEYSMDQLEELGKSPLVACPSLLMDIQQHQNVLRSARKDGKMDYQKRYDNNANNNNKNRRGGRYNMNRRDDHHHNNHHNHHQHNNHNHYHNNNNHGYKSHHRKDEDDMEPEWMDTPPDLADMDMGKTVEEFEAWKARQRQAALEAAGGQAEESVSAPMSVNPTANLGAGTSDADGVDRMFGMWSSPSTVSASLPKSSSKFSRFFGGPSSSTPPPQALEEQSEEPLVAQQPVPAPAPQENGEKKDFARIMQMLDKSQEPSPVQTPLAPKSNPMDSPMSEKSQPAFTPRQSKMQFGQQPQPAMPAMPQSPNQQVQSQPQPANDLFFQSLLSKGTPPPPQNEKPHASKPHSAAQAKPSAEQPKESPQSPQQQSPPQPSMPQYPQQQQQQQQHGGPLPPQHPHHHHHHPGMMPPPPGMGEMMPPPPPPGMGPGA